MPKKIFIFDIDETLLVTPNRYGLINQTDRTATINDPYSGNYGQCQTIQKEKLAKIFRDILANGDEIAFVTSGMITKDKIKAFCLSEYDVDLGDNFQHHRGILDKTPVLKQIAGDKPYPDIVFVDNSSHHIEPAKRAGFTTVYADNNATDRTNGTRYIRHLDIIVSGAKLLEENLNQFKKIHKALKRSQNSWFKSSSYKRDSDFNVQNITTHLIGDVDEKTRTSEAFRLLKKYNGNYNDFNLLKEIYQYGRSNQVFRKKEAAWVKQDNRQLFFEHAQSSSTSSRSAEIKRALEI